MTNAPVHTEQHNGCLISIYYDDDPQSPRAWDNLGTMACWHRRYHLSDEQPREMPPVYLARLVNDLYDDDCKAQRLYREPGDPLAMNTIGFHCPWDSGQVGFIHVSLEDVRKEYGVQRVSGKLRRTVEDALRAEVGVYDDYLRGDIYGYVIERDGDHVDSCWGYFGDFEGHCLTEARSLCCQ